MKTSLMLNLFVGYIIPFTGAYAFALLGCVFKEERENTASVFAFLFFCVVSHGGGFTRDLISNLVTHKFILPAACTSYDSWIPATLGFATYVWLKKSGKSRVLRSRAILQLLGLLDATAVANYCVAGANRVVEVYHFSSPVIIALLSAITSLGGGLWTLAIWRPDKFKKLQANCPYYIVTFLCACAASCAALDRSPYCTALSLSLSFFSASVYSIRCLFDSTDWNWFAEYLKEYYLNVYKRFSVSDRISEGQYFNLIKNPFKGICSYTAIPMHARCGSSIASYTVTTFYV